MANDARKKGVTGVPFTVINGKWAVSGGQTSDVYTQVGTRICAWSVACSRNWLDFPEARWKRTSSRHPRCSELL